MNQPPLSLHGAAARARRAGRPLAALCVALACVAVIAAAGLAGRAAAAEPAQGPVAGTAARGFAAGQVLVKFRPGTPAAQSAAVLREHGLTQIDEIAAIGWRRLRVPEGHEEEMAARLARNPNVLHAVTNGVIEPADTSPNDPFFVTSSQWNLLKVQAPGAWDVVTGSIPITIALIDTGVDGTHPDLTAQMVDGFFQYTSGGVVYTGTIPAGTKNDDHGHGTHVAGILGAATNNAIGVAGMYWGARIMPFRSQDASGYGEDYDVAAGLVWVVDHGARVVNISLGGTAYNQALADAAAYAWAHGVVVVAAGGNGSGANPTYPAAYTDVLGIAPTGPVDQWVNFTTTAHGYWIDAAAPGLNVLSTYLYASYRQMNGTSMASPLVAGLAGLVIGANPALTNAQVTRIITSTAEKVGGLDYPAGWNQYLGYGRVNAALAISATPRIDVSGPLTAAVGAPFEYLVTLHAGGLDAWESVVITDALPAGAAFVAASDGGVLAGGVVSWTAGTLAPGGLVTRTLTVTATDTVTNSLFGASKAGGLLAEGYRPVVTAVGPRLAVTLAGPAHVMAGDPITYTLVVTNWAVQTATGLVLTDALPAGAWFVGASDGGVLAGGVISWTAPSLQPGASLTRTLVVTAEQALVNSDYGVSCLEGRQGTGAGAVRTIVMNRAYYLPMLMRGVSWG